MDFWTEFAQINVGGAIPQIDGWILESVTIAVFPGSNFIILLAADNQEYKKKCFIPRSGTAGTTELSMNQL